MKKIKFFPSVPKSIVAGIVALLSAVALVGIAASVSPAALNTTPLFTNTVSSNSTATATVERPFPVDAGKVLAMQATFWAADTGTSNLVLNLNGSDDSVNFTTTALKSPTFTLDGTNHTTAIVIVGTNIPARFLSLDSMSTTQTNDVTVTNVFHIWLPAQ
jgi:hypothetical protein